MTEQFPRVIRGRTMLELKVKARQAMGWADRRSWTEAERLAFRDLYSLRCNFKTDFFEATLRGADDAFKPGIFDAKLRDPDA